MKKPEQELLDLAYVWRGTVDKVLQDTQDRVLYRLKTPDLYRLLSLRTWSLKYNLPIEEILRVLVTYWAKRFERKFKTQGKGKKSLGCKVATLCGNVSEEILKDYISKTYPSNEHVAVFKSQQQERYMKVREMKVFYSNTVDMFMKRYKKTTEKARKTNQITLSKGELTKRRYPGNPWL